MTDRVVGRLQYGCVILALFGCLFASWGALTWNGARFLAGMLLVALFLGMALLLEVLLAMSQARRHQRGPG